MTTSKNNGPCNIDGCTNQANSRGWCMGHYLRWYHKGDTQAHIPLRPRSNPPCAISDEDCNGNSKTATGLCDRHSRRLAKYGDPYWEEPPRPLSYWNAHQKVRAKRGPASAHRCAKCAGPASQWSYTHDDPNELTGPCGKTKDGRVKTAAYSTDPAHYEPLCVSCHTIKDSGWDPDHCPRGHAKTPENRRPGRGDCRECGRERAREARRRKPKKDPNICRNGHDKREVGLDPRGRCAECTRQTRARSREKRRARAEREGSWNFTKGHAA